MQLVTVDSTKVNRQVIFSSFRHFEHTLSLLDLYGSLPLFITTQTTLQSNITQVYFNSISYSYMYAACFGLYLDHPPACQHKDHTKEDTIRI